MAKIEREAFGSLLKVLRKQKRISQQTLASMLGVHRNTISAWECGVYLPATRGFILEIARALACSDEQQRRLLQSALLEL